MNALAYRTARATLDADRSSIVEVWREGLTQNGAPEAKFDWYYGRNPQGRPDVVLLQRGREGETAGAASVAPRRMRAGGRDIQAGMLVDFVVRPADRNFFAALALQRALRDLAEHGHSLLLALPNRLSVPVFERARYVRLGDMQRFVRVLRSAPYLARHLPAALSGLVGPLLDCAALGFTAWRQASRGLRTEWVERPDERFDELWEKASGGDSVIGLRDRQFLAWRFVDCPLYQCRFFTACVDGRLLGYAACWPHGASLKVLDFLVDPAIRGAARQLFAALARDARRAGYDSLAVEFFGDAAMRAELAAVGFVVRAARPLYAAGPSCDALADLPGWHITCADEDW